MSRVLDNLSKIDAITNDVLPEAGETLTVQGRAQMQVDLSHKLMPLLDGIGGPVPFEISLGGFVIRLEQTRKPTKRHGGEYSVTYGLQTWNYLSHPDACTRLGEAIMHGLTLEGRIR